MEKYSFLLLTILCAHVVGDYNVPAPTHPWHTVYPVMGVIYLVYVEGVIDLRGPASLSLLSVSMGIRSGIRVLCSSS